MKKFLLSSFVIFSFLTYSVIQRGDEEIKPVIAPPSITSTPTPSAASSQITTPMPSAATSPTGTQITQVPTSTPTPRTSLYKDGSFTGDVADAIYGNIQVQAIIQGGKIVDVKFLQYPSDRSTSVYINSQADPMLTQEAIQAQSANVDIISGATASSNAFVESLGSALAKAKS